MSMRNSPSLFDSIRTKKCIVIVILLFKYLSPFHSTFPISSWTTRARDGKRTRASISLMPNKHTSSNNAISNRFPRIQYLLISRRSQFWQGRLIGKIDWLGHLLSLSSKTSTFPLLLHNTVHKRGRILNTSILPPCKVAFEASACHAFALFC